jgi:type III pantothenate kinase
MKLYVDVGNSAIKWATAEELRTARMHVEESNNLPATIEQPWAKLTRPDAVHIASVRRQDVEMKLRHWIEQQWQITPLFAETRRCEHGVTNGYTQPEQLGVDRWLALIAARALSPSPKIVVDCGSATTIDAMDGEGRHIGGVIMPGFRLFSDVLRRKTDIPDHHAGSTIDYFATDTASAILSGTAVAQSACVEKLYRLLQSRDAMADVQCIVTGGDAGLLAEHLQLPFQVIPGLVLDGLRIQIDDAG